jgi:arabinan endo-1,5-alpha-L-arabinosidase
MLQGTWTDHGVVLETYEGHDHFNAIDPNLVDDGAGNYYLQFGSYFDGIYQAPFDFKNQKPINPDHNSYINLVRNITTSSWDNVEGSFIYKNNGTYWMFYSQGAYGGFTQGHLPWAGYEYKVRVGKSSSPSGPYRDQNGQLLTENGGTIFLGSQDDIYAPGGGSVIYDPLTGDSRLRLC